MHGSNLLAKSGEINLPCGWDYVIYHWKALKRYFPVLMLKIVPPILGQWAPLTSLQSYTDGGLVVPLTYHWLWKLMIKKNTWSEF